MIENTIFKKNKEGKKANVFDLTFPSLQLVELASHAGFDAINCDGEHGNFSPESIDDICRVANGYGMSVIARVPDKSPYWINLFLDRGIQGIVGPHVETQKEAQDFADACLFPPHGKRSWGGGRGTEFNDDVKINEYGGKLEFAKWTNKNMLVIAQIESVPGWDNLNEILEVEGLSGITGGPNDLAASMGIPGEPNNPKREKLTNEIDNTAREKNKVVQIDIMRNLSIQSLMIDYGRKFINEDN
tara:strand:- start:15631 stop:16362 length:732 start_codon:yes stop_codon:yes gene_type:complete